MDLSLDKYFYDHRQGARQVGEGKRVGFPYFLFNNTSVKRLGSPQEIAEAVSFLASDAAGYINGHNLAIDGGRFSA